MRNWRPILRCCFDSRPAARVKIDGGVEFVDEPESEQSDRSGGAAKLVDARSGSCGGDCADVWREALAWLDAPLVETSETPAEAPPIPEKAVSLDEVIAEIDAEVELLGDARAIFGAMALKRKAGQWAKYIVFSIAGTDYAVPMANVLKYIVRRRSQRFLTFPNGFAASPNLRGDILSIVDLRGFSRNRIDCRSPGTRVIVVRSLKEELMTGVVVDQVIGIRTLVVDRIGEVSSPTADPIERFVAGRYETENHHFVVLDIEELLLSSEMKQFEAV